MNQITRLAVSLIIVVSAVAVSAPATASATTQGRSDFALAASTGPR